MEGGMLVGWVCYAEIQVSWSKKAAVKQGKTVTFSLAQLAEACPVEVQKLRWEICAACLIRLLQAPKYAPRTSRDSMVMG